MCTTNACASIVEFSVESKIQELGGLDTESRTFYELDQIACLRRQSFKHAGYHQKTASRCSIEYDTFNCSSCR
ncbi:hypothetical protein TNCV_4689351 [Trichonephila clavipes]|nr:hypothetical protein TNCV_4689351 [Trichonephila clavipes]